MLAIASNAVTISGHMTDAALPRDARLELEARNHELTAALASTSPDKVRKIIFQLGTMRSRNEEDLAKLRFTVEQYIEICSDVPGWALERAVWAHLGGEAGGSPVFMPTAGELRRFAMREVHNVRAEQRKIASVLSASIAPPSKPPDPQRRRDFIDKLFNRQQRSPISTA